ncbi:MAG: histidinol-phosphatase [Acidobacteriota bacterium]|jgi:histidinol phosphatase-like enzyme (inositol monophosphatase family)|nr:histidinol-phosphatase [Acidobacteriota bacterium]
MSEGVLKESLGESELRELLDFGVEAAREAGEITLRYFRQKFETRLKGKDNFVTQADLEAEEFLRREISKRFPDDAIVGEEGGESAGSTGRRWIIDPIDGTYSFVHGVPFYGVLLGVEVGGDPAVGVINIPALGEIVYAARGLGCFWNGEPAHVSQTERLEDALLLSTDFGSCARHGFGAAAEELQRRAAMRRTWGDCYGYVLVATGRADVMLDPAMNVWDCAALLPVLEEAGGTFTDWQGRRTIHSGNAVATNETLFVEVMQIIKKNGRNP